MAGENARHARTMTGPGGHRLVRGAVAAAVVALLSLAAGFAPAAGSPRANVYGQTNLVSDIPGVARTTDPNLVNPWGMAAGPQTPVWVSDNGTDVATIYSGAIGGSPLTPVPLVVDIPGGAPTGQVFNPTDSFVVHSGSAAGPALFIFSSESGSITGWNPSVPPPSPSTAAQTAVTTPGAVYKGLAIARTPRGEQLFAANFSAAAIDVFNGRFQRLSRPNAFVDPHIPEGYAPFNVQSIGDRLYVTYAKQDSEKMDDVPGPGHGFVDVFTKQGRLIRRLISHGPLNSPWGLALAPAGFGKFSGALLVGNFGDGRINAFDPDTGRLLGDLRNQDGNPITIDGLWALRFGNGVAGSRRTLLFTAGIADEEHGLLGAIRAVK
jgi:uncharacterized protein (TIGR03118 family)